jgi:hypothetical protein
MDVTLVSLMPTKLFSKLVVNVSNVLTKQIVLNVLLTKLNVPNVKLDML